MSETPPSTPIGRAPAQAPLELGPTRAPIILVPLDGSQHATSALPVARALAELEGAILHVVHVAPGALAAGELAQRLRLTREEVEGAVLVPLSGPPAAAIVRQAREWHCRRIVMCAHTGAEQPRGALGRMAQEVMLSAPCPIVLVQPARGSHPWTLRRLLLPHDGTPTSALAIGPAADLAHRAGAELMVLHVAGGAPPDEPGTLAMPRYVDQPQHEWPAWAREFLDRLRTAGHTPQAVRMRLTVVQGEPASEIARVATEQRSDLVVLAWRGRLEPERAATVRAVIREAPCPVMVCGVGVPR